MIAVSKRLALFAGAAAVAALVTLAPAGAAPPPARVVVQGLAFPLDGQTPSPLVFERAFPNLAFDRPVLLAAPADGTDRIFVVEQAGRILVFPNDDAAMQAKTFLDLRGRVRSGGEEGLVGLAFCPDYARTGELYVHYTPDSFPRTTRLSRFRVDPLDPDRANPGNEEIILEVAQPFATHNGGTIAFGPDGMLYVGYGDGGDVGDPFGNAQNLTTLLGNILRIDPRGGRPYAIPPDNPLVGRGGGAREEIWAWGLRNPFRFSFDRQTGTLWAGDVGQDAVEEIDIVTRGANLGWDLYEADRWYDNPGGVPFSVLAAPVVTYGHTEGRCVIGGHVYRGARWPALRGIYFYADFVSGRVWGLIHDGQNVVSNGVVAQVASPSSFGEDEAGELYAVSYAGTIHRLAQRGVTPQPFPQRLSQTGLFADTVALTPAPGVLEYEVAAPLWSDGAVKRRFLALPGVERIGFEPTGAWRWPLGTVLAKHFELPLDASNPGGARRRLETRVLVLERTGWAGYVYRWNAQQTDAELIASGQTETYRVADPAAPGGIRDQTWTYPSRSDCNGCHTAAAGFVLGPRTAQLNRDRAFPGGAQNQLARWEGMGLFDRAIGQTAALPAWPHPHDATADLDRRARAYLASNCSNCHRPGGPTPVALDLRFDTPLADTGLLDAPAAGDLGIAGAAIVAPGSQARSVLMHRMRRTDHVRMPPLGSSVPDDAGLFLLGVWIDQLPPPTEVDVRFSVTMPRTLWGERVVVTGSHPALGDWNPQNGVVLTTDATSFPVWHGSARLPASGFFEWKAVVTGPRGALWESGGNRAFKTHGVPVPLGVSFRDLVPVDFTARVPGVPAAAVVRIVGSEVQLGGWDPLAGRALQRDPADPDRFFGRVLVPSRWPVFGKLVIEHAGGGVQWERGGDRRFDLPAWSSPYPLDLGGFRY